MDSLNWAGYAVTPGSDVTAVNSTFTVSTAGTLPPGSSATWAGIGGFNTSDLIQAGVGEQSVPSDPVFGPRYFAWYELLPAAETPISGCAGDPNCTVNPGDSVTVDIDNVSGDTWSVSLRDAGHWTYSHTVTYASSESSAEWIQEAPTLVAPQTIPAPAGTVHFGPTSTYTSAGVTHTIAAAGNPTLINESPVGLINEATTSALASDGQSFNVCVYAQTCPAVAPTTTTATSPTTVVQDYLAAINAHDYRRAWALGGDNLGGSYAAFAHGFSATREDALTSISSQGDKVYVAFVAFQDSGAGVRYQGTYTVNNGVIVGADVYRTSG